MMAYDYQAAAAERGVAISADEARAMQALEPWVRLVLEQGTPPEDAVLAALRLQRETADRWLAEASAPRVQVSRGDATVRGMGSPAWDAACDRVARRLYDEIRAEEST